MLMRKIDVSDSGNAKQLPLGPTRRASGVMRLVLREKRSLASQPWTAFFLLNS
jgi:hypothetical protein